MATTFRIPQLLHRSYRPVIQCLASNPAQTILLPIRHASGKSDGKGKAKKKKKKKSRSTFRQYDLKDAEQFSLCDAMRYIRAFEVGHPPTSSKYDIALKLRTPKNGPAIRNRLRLPHAIKTALRIAVICPSPSPIATAALASGATICGDDDLLALIRDSPASLPFDRLLCHMDSAPKLAKANLGRVLGPKGMMPNAKLGTVTRDVGAAVKSMVGASEYREKLGVIRMAVGQLGFTPEELQRNIRVFMEGVKRDVAGMSERVTKEIHEVVLSSTNAPGFPLNGEFRSPISPPTRDLSVI